MLHGGSNLSGNAMPFGVVMIALGALGLWTNGRELTLLRRIQRTGATATGTVVRHIKGFRGVDRPVIRFANQRGHYVDFTPRRALRSTFVHEGEQFPVRYLIDEPHYPRLANEEAQPRSVLLSTLVFAGFMILGLVLLAISLTPSASQGGQVHSGSTTKSVSLVVASVAGLCILGFGGYRIRSTLVMRRDGITTTGRIVREYSERVGEGYKAVIEFVDTKQRRRQFVANSPSRSAGGTVPVTYWPDRPDKARVASVSRTTYSVAVGTLFCALVVCVMLFY